LHSSAERVLDGNSEPEKLFLDLGGAVETAATNKDVAFVLESADMFVEFHGRPLVGELCFSPVSCRA
jgi:hypothetical protein